MAFALRMLSTIWRTKHTRILFIAGGETKETTVTGLGTVFHWIPKARFAEDFKVAQSDEVRAIADFYTKSAQKIIEPTRADILRRPRTTSSAAA